MERIIWTEDDKRRSQEFIRLIETNTPSQANLLCIAGVSNALIVSEDGNPARVNIKQALDSKLQDGNPVKEILLKMNLPYHTSILTDSKIHIKMKMEAPGSSRHKDS
ncbi:hypothetical protein Tco_0015401 [Tanacetum coccineum]